MAFEDVSSKITYNLVGQNGSARNLTFYAPYQPDLATLETLADEGKTRLDNVQDVEVAGMELSFKKEDSAATGLAGSDTNVVGELIITQDGDGISSTNRKRSLNIYSPNATVADDSATGLDEGAGQLRSVFEWMEDNDISLTEGATVTGVLTEQVFE